MNKHEKKYKATDQLLKNSFMALKREKGNGAVSVKDICERSEVSRAAFYLHYETIEELVKTVEEEAADDLIHALSLYQYDKDSLASQNTLFQVIRDNPDLFNYYFHLSDGTAKRLFDEFLYKRTFPIWKENSQLDDYEVDLAFWFVLNGTMTILERWLSNDFQHTEQTRNLIEKLVTEGLYSLIYTA